jgi:hypothetical protein
VRSVITPNLIGVPVQLAAAAFPVLVPADAVFPVLVPAVAEWDFELLLHAATTKLRPRIVATTPRRYLFIMVSFPLVSLALLQP